MNKKIVVLFGVFSAFCITSSVFAAASDGSGPWADSVVSHNQGIMKNGSAVPSARSNPQAAVGVAENDTVDEHFYSLGFGGNIVLKFENGVRDGVIVVEATNVSYPDEKAKIEVSQDGNTWVTAGNVSQDGQVSMPESLSCVNYVKITDQSNPSDYPDDIADGYDVDGVKAVNAEPCDSGNNGGNTGGENPSPTPTPVDNQLPTPTPSQSSGSSNSSNGSSGNNSQPQQCNAGKPGTPSITSIQKTNNTTVKLVWTSVSPATSYAISYGTSKGNYQYGVPSTGNVTSFEIGGLDPRATYYFSIRAINDCMPGDASGEQTPGNGQVLGASTGEVLGASTEVLAATGHMQEIVAGIAAVFAGCVTYVLLKKASK